MKKKIIAIMGEPATGKSTLVKKLMEGLEWETVELVKLVPTHYNKQHNLHIIGKYEDGEKFPGTDRLSMAVQPAAIEFTTAVGANMLFEGDRLSTGSFLEHLCSIEDAEVKIIYLKVSNDTLHFRHGDRGDTQSEKFLQGRRTKYSNILGSFDLMPFIDEYRNETIEDQTKVVSAIKEFLGVS